MRRPLLLTNLAAIALVALMVTATVLHTRREKEWAHGGDAVTVNVDYRSAGKNDVTEAARALGWPVEGERGVLGDQALVVRVAWTGASRDGRFELIALDRRSAPPRVLNPTYGRDASGDIGSEWGSNLNILAERYAWLAGVTPPVDNAYGEPSIWEGPMAVGTPAAATGTVMAVFDLGRKQQPSWDPARDLMLALVYWNDGVRWAKQVPLVSAGTEPLMPE
ncbi:hypothetical protein COO58_25965 [Micromonospora sp. WMMA1996]|uniref:hypothetical protein n=1 Tax=Micromonospora sp. WMMA1996 TaxID=2039878 RepID=UPI000BF80F2B|nr:hypothetical protein [Micromonospora sp. WMMA1996]PGH41285.1 hypothetical protein COO58_25965 [Micromonospora sp. WMMA1996]